MDRHQRVILLIDDDPDYRLAVRQILEAHGFRVVEAEDGESGLRVFREHTPDLVIVDLMMEEIDSGVQFMKEVRGMHPNTPVYLMSSVGDSLSMTTNAAQLGFTGVLQKPVNSARLVAVMDSHLR